MSAALVWRGMLITVTAAILLLSLTPSPPSDGLGWDKANHAAAMALVTALAWRAAKPNQWALMVAGLYALILGALIEALQAICTTTRTAEWGDLLADATGVAVAAAALYGWQQTRGRYTSC